MVPHLVWGMESRELRSGLNGGMNVGMCVMMILQYVRVDCIAAIAVSFSKQLTAHWILAVVRDR